MPVRQPRLKYRMGHWREDMTCESVCIADMFVKFGLNVVLMENSPRSAQKPQNIREPIAFCCWGKIYGLQQYSSSWPWASLPTSFSSLSSPQFIVITIIIAITTTIIIIIIINNNNKNNNMINIIKLKTVIPSSTESSLNHYRLKSQPRPCGQRAILACLMLELCFYVHAYIPVTDTCTCPL